MSNVSNKITWLMFTSIVNIKHVNVLETLDVDGHYININVKVLEKLDVVSNKITCLKVTNIYCLLLIYIISLRA